MPTAWGGGIINKLKCALGLVMANQQWQCNEGNNYKTVITQNMITAIILITTTNEDLLIVPDISFMVPQTCVNFLPFSYLSHLLIQYFSDILSACEK